MKTLIVCYSKTGNTRKVAQKVQATLNCELDEIEYDPKAHAVTSGKNPAGYGRVILMCPIWGFRLPEPMSLYLSAHKDIKNFRLAVTCGGLGLRGCVSDCEKILGRAPETAVKIREKQVKDDSYSIDNIVG